MIIKKLQVQTQQLTVNENEEAYISLLKISLPQNYELFPFKIFDYFYKTKEK